MSSPVVFPRLEGGPDNRTEGNIRLAIVGCGAVSEMGHIPAALQSENVLLAALVDSDPVRAERLAERFNVRKAVTDLAELAGEVDAVVLATPPHVHPVLAQQAFSAGLHVLCEKPLANSSADCRIMLTAASQAKRVLAVAHTYRYLPNRIHVHSLLQERILGSVLKINVEQGDPSDWPTRTGYSVRNDLVAGGVLLNEGIHSLDTLFWWFGTPMDFEYQDDALGGLESNVRIKIKFIDGVSADVRVSRTCKLANRIVIEGTAGSISLAIYDRNQVFVKCNGKTTTHDTSTGKFSFPGMVAEQLRDFVQSIQMAKPPRVTGEDGMRVIEFIEKCYASKRRRPLPQRAPAPGLTW